MSSLINSDFEDFAGSKDFKAVLKTKLDSKKYQAVLKIYQLRNRAVKASNGIGRFTTLGCQTQKKDLYYF